MKKIFIFVLMAAACFMGGKEVQAAGPTEITSDINAETIWTKEHSPYVILNTINVNAPLTIKPGVVVKFIGYPNFVIKNALTAVGNSSEKIIFTSACDSTYENTNIYCGNRRYPIKGDWGGIYISDNKYKVTLEYAKILYGSNGVSYQSGIGYSPYRETSIKRCEIYNSATAGILIRNTEPIIESNIIAYNYYGILDDMLDYDRILKVNNNSIFNNKQGLYATKANTPVDAKYNWWGSPTGPRAVTNLLGAGNYVYGNLVVFTPWLQSEPNFEDVGCQENCFSNVMFLPGIKASRLYKNGAMGTVDQLWIPNYFGSDLEQLALDSNGKSINNVYTKDILDEVALPYIGGNIYKSLENNLATLKKDGTINDYNLFAYDWRQNVQDVATNGTPYQGEIKSAIETVKSLANTSKSKKVTLIAHSNGGLLAKAIMLELEKLGLADKVDKIVMVGTPQMGTPLSIPMLLYGYDESVLAGSLISQTQARTLAENMPGAYGLLPSASFFQRMNDPFITFSASHSKYKDFTSTYGQSIDSYGEFKDFLLAKDGRTKPASSDVDSENVLNQTLIEQSQQTQQQLDAWTPPANVELIQIAGWGLDTVSGLDYTEKEKTQCIFGSPTSVPICKGTGQYEPVYDPKFTVDGDKVVAAPSALMFAEAPNVKRYWVDLHKYNNSSQDREHKNILEVDSVQYFLNDVIKNNYLNSKLPDFISVARPDDYSNEKPRLRMSLYSPLDINLYDENGNHTGPRVINVGGEERTVFETAIPNSYYYQFGERKYVGFPEGEKIEVKMDGYDKGSYTLKLEEVKVADAGEEEISHATFLNLPTTENTVVTFTVPESGLADMTTLKADIDNDGKNDYTVDQVPNGTAVLDITPPVIEIKSPEAKQYLNDQLLKFDYSIVDDYSDLKDTETEIRYDGKPWKNKEIDLSLENLGEHKFSIFATDKAGNKAEKEIKFTYISDIETIAKNIDHYANLDMIANQETRDFLQEKVDELSHIQEMIAKMSDKKNDNGKQNQIKLLNKKIDDLIGFVEDKLSAEIKSPAKEVLIESLNYVKIKED